MDVNYVSGSAATGTGTTALTVSVPAAAVGFTGILTVAIRSAAGTAKVTGITGSTGTWVHVGDIPNSTPTVIVSMFYCAAVTTSGTATCTISGTSTFTAAAMDAYSGVGSVATAGAVTATGTGTGLAVAVTTTAPRSFIVAALGSAYAVAQSSVTGTARAGTDTGTTSGGVTVAVGDNGLAAGAGTSVTVASATGVNSAAWAAIAVELIPAAPAIKLTIQAPAPVLVARIPWGVQQPSRSIRASTSVQPIAVPFPQELLISPGGFTLAAGLTLQLQALLQYSNNFLQLVTTSPYVTWSTSDASKATVSAAGLVTGVASGSVTIMAAFAQTGVANLSGSSPGTITIAVLEGVTISPANPSLPIGETQQMSAIAVFSDSTNTDVTSLATWSSGTPGHVSINSSGLATGVALGTSILQASYMGFMPTTTATATAAVLVSIAITPVDPIIAPLGTQAFVATGTYSDGSTANLTSSATWASSDTAIATIGASTGLATATSSMGGATAITATLGPIVGTTALVVQNTTTSPTLNSITATPNTVVLTFSAGVDNLQADPALWTVGIIGNPANIAPVTITAISVVGAVVTLTTTTQTGGASYVLNVPAAAIFSTTGYPWLGPFAQDFTGGIGLTNTFVVTVIDAQTLLVTFSRPVLQTGLHGALQTLNWSLNPGNLAIFRVTAVTAAQYQLKTAPQTYGTVYTLTTNNILDTFFNPI